MCDKSHFVWLRFIWDVPDCFAPLCPWEAFAEEMKILDRASKLSSSLSSGLLPVVRKPPTYMFFFLVACARHYKSFCQSVGPSIAVNSERDLQQLAMFYPLFFSFLLCPTRCWVIIQWGSSFWTKKPPVAFVFIMMMMMMIMMMMILVTDMLW